MAENVIKCKESQLKDAEFWFGMALGFSILEVLLGLYSVLTSHVFQERLRAAMAGKICESCSEKKFNEDDGKRDWHNLSYRDRQPFNVKLGDGDCLTCSTFDFDYDD